jgi:hypothetical protein
VKRPVLKGNSVYCPRCSQPQSSDDAGFCTRCGFQLALVKELLVTGGAPPANANDFHVSSLTSGRKGVRRGTKLIFFSIILLPLFFGLSFILDSPGPLVPPAIIFLAGLASILYSSIFGEDLPRAKQPFSSTFPEISKYRTLTPSAVPLRPELNDVRVETAEIISPPSVTEHTTNLLRKSETQMDNR